MIRGTLVAAMVLAASSASAAVLLESYDGERPIDADQLLAPFRATLESHGIATTAAKILELDAANLPLSPTHDATLTATQLVSQIDIGLKVATKLGPNGVVDFDQAIADLDAAVLAAHENPAVVAGDKTSREWMTRALAELAFAHNRLANDPAHKKDRAAHQKAVDDALAEQIRSYPDFAITSDKYGPEIAKLYSEIHDRLEAGPHGNLTVRVSRPSARIYVDEFDRGQSGKLEHRAMTPGTYRVLVVADGVGRLYHVTVPTNGTTRDRVLDIDWVADTAFIVTREWAGWVWPIGYDRVALAAPVRARVIGDAVIVASIVWRDGLRFVTATKFSSAGKEVTSGAIKLTGDRDEAKITALATTIITGAGSPADFIPAPTPTPTPTPAPTPAPELLSGAPTVPPAVAGPKYTTRWQGLAAGGGVVALGAGAYLTRLNGKTTCGAEIAFADCKYVHATSIVGWPTLGAGAVAATFGMLWYATHHEAHHTAAIVAAGVALAITGSVLFAVDQDSASLGIGIGLAGLVTIGIGVYVGQHSAHELHPSQPTVSIAPSGGTVGWSGTF